MFRIRDILIWIQILISVNLITDPGPAADPDPALLSLFVSDFQDANKNNFFFQIFGLLFSVGIFYINFQRKQVIKSH